MRSSSPRKSMTWTTVAATIAAALVSALMLAANEAGSLARMGSEGRAMSSLGGSKKAALGRPGAAPGTDSGRDEQKQRGMLEH